MKYYVEIVDHWEEELDIMGPFNSESEANEAAFDKWNGSDSVAEIRIVKVLPAVQFDMKKQMNISYFDR